MHVRNYNHLIANGVCRESFGRVIGILNQKVNKTLTAKNSTIILTTSKEYLAYKIFGLDEEPSTTLLCGDVLVAMIEKF